MGPKGEASACRNEGPPVGPRSPPALPGKVAVRGVCGRGRCAVRVRPVTRPDLRSGSHLWASGGREAGVAGAKRLAAASRGAEEEVSEPLRWAEGRGSPGVRRRAGGAGRAACGDRNEVFPPSLNFVFAGLRSAAGEARGGWWGSPPRSAGITWCWRREGEPPPSSRFSYSFLQSQRSTPARLERGAGLGRAGAGRAPPPAPGAPLRSGGGEEAAQVRGASAASLLLMPLRDCTPARRPRLREDAALSPRCNFLGIVPGSR